MKEVLQISQLVATSPSRFEMFFTRCGREFAKPAGSDMNRIGKIGAEYDIHYVQP